MRRVFFEELGFPLKHGFSKQRFVGVLQ